MPTTACPACGQPMATAHGPCSGCGRPVAANAADTLTHAGPVPADAPTVTSAGPPVAPPAADRPMIPGYTILGELGRGGMGVVYRAHDASLNRPVALKVMLAGVHGGATAVERFRTEALAAAAVQHRHIVRLFAVGDHGGLPFMVMELVPGGSLAARLAVGAFDPPAAARVVEAVARGVAAAHDRGIVHRDLKPANVLFTADGEPKVADFGLAKVGDTGLTASGAVMGTLSYMAPEQARGDTRAVGPTTDVWALGAMLHECLTGHPPFRGASAPDTLRRVCESDPEPLDGVPKDLATICWKCLEKDPARRYSSAAAVADDLARFRAGEPIAARPRGPTVRLARWVGRHKGPTYAAAGAVLAAVVSLVLLSLKSKPVPPGPDPAPVAGLPPDLALVPPDAFTFVSVRPNDVWDRPALKKMYGALVGADVGGPVGPGPVDQVIENATGLRLADVDRVTLVLRTEWAGKKDPDFLVVVRMTAPFDVKRSRDKLEELFGGFESKDRRGRRYYTAKTGDLTLALFKAGEREAVFGVATEVEAAIDRLDAGPVDGPLSPALEAAARGHTLVAGLRGPAGLIGLVPAADAQLPPGVAGGVGHLRSVTAAVVTLDLRPAAQDHPLPGADLTARFRFPTEAGAAAAVPAVREALGWLGRSDPEPATTGLAALLPAVQTAAREAAVRQDGAEVVVTGGPRWSPAEVAGVGQKPVLTSARKLSLIGNALHAYADTHGHFPPAVIRSDDGRPLYSWRVELLPFLEQDQIYRRLNRNEAWDHSDNKALLGRVPEVFGPSADDPARTPTGTRFQALVGKGGVFDPTAKTNLPAITDGSSNTILLVEAGEPVHWGRTQGHRVQARWAGPETGQLSGGHLSGGTGRRLDQDADARQRAPGGPDGPVHPERE